MAVEVNVSNVSKRLTLKGLEVEVLRNISFTSPRSEITCVVGPTGSGKTTLMRIIVGLEKPTRGRVEFKGSDRVKIGWIPQKPVLLPWKTILGNVELALKPFKLPRSERKRRAYRILELLGLEDYASRKPRELTEAEKCYAVLAVTLALNPNLIVVDEPFASLDEVGSGKVKNLLETVVSETGKTMIVATRSLEDGLDLADSLVVLSGRPATVRDVVHFEAPRGGRRALALYDSLYERIVKVFSDTICEAVLKVKLKQIEELQELVDIEDW